MKLNLLYWYVRLVFFIFLTCSIARFDFLEGRVFYGTFLLLLLI